MRIAFVKQKQVEFGGGEGYMKRLMRGCVQAGHEVHLIAARWQVDDFDFPVIVHTVSIIRRSRRTKLFSFAESVRQFVNSKTFDCIFSMERTDSQQIWRAGEGVHKVWLEHRAEFEPWFKTWFNAHSSGHRAYLEMEKRCVLSSPHIIANSEMVRGYIQRIYPNCRAQIHVIHNGCDTSFYTPENREQHRSELCDRYELDLRRPLLLFPGSDWVRKGFVQAVEVLSRIPEAVLFVAGRDNPKRWGRVLKNFEVTDRVVFLPPVRDMRSLYRAIDVSLLPTWSDPFANITLESIACGTPLVTTAYNGGCEIVKRGENGFVVRNPADVAGMVGGVKALLERRGELGRAQAVSASVSDCTLERNWRETLDVIQKAGAC